MTRTLLLALACAAAVRPADAEDGASDRRDARRFREPVALAVLAREGSTRVVAANRRSGSVSVIDPAAGRVVSEVEVGRRLTDLAALPDGQHLVALGGAANELLVLDATADAVRVVGRVGVAADPAGLAVAGDGSFVAVASGRSRRVTRVALGGGDSSRPTVAWSAALPFAPRNLVVTPGGSRVIAADAERGGLAVLEAGTGKIEAIRNLPAHNIRGMAVAPDGRTLVLAHQTLGRGAKSSFEQVHFGGFLGNHLRVLKLDAVLSAPDDAGALADGKLIPIGLANNAAGDPASLAFDRSGRLAVALAGVDEVGLFPRNSWDPIRIAVGRRPLAVAIGPDGGSVFVADALDDTISVVPMGGGAARTIPLGPRPEPDAAARGERLFSDARLSNDGWMSCQSCHADGHTVGVLADTLGDGSYGAPKRTPSLLGTGDTGPWGWLGRFERLEDQVRASIESTMRGPKPTDAQVADLTAYLRSLQPPGPDLGGLDRAAVGRGRAVFEARECGRCHAEPEFTTPERYDVGLVDEVGRRAFNPPSLRGVGLRAPLLHDGRAAAIEDVFRVHKHPRGAEMTPEEVADLSAYLRTL